MHPTSASLDPHFPLPPLSTPPPLQPQTHHVPVSGAPLSIQPAPPPQVLIYSFFNLPFDVAGVGIGIGGGGGASCGSDGGGGDGSYYVPAYVLSSYGEVPRKRLLLLSLLLMVVVVVEGMRVDSAFTVAADVRCKQKMATILVFPYYFLPTHFFLLLPAPPDIHASFTIPTTSTSTTPM